MLEKPNELETDCQRLPSFCNGHDEDDFRLLPGLLISMKNDFYPFTIVLTLEKERREGFATPLTLSFSFWGLF